MLTLQQFIDTKTKADDVNPVMFGHEMDDGPAPGWIYAEACAINDLSSDGRIFLTLGNIGYDEPATDIGFDRLERQLYLDHYLGELEREHIDGLIERAARDLSDGPLAAVQNAIGQDDGGFASVYFTGENDWFDEMPSKSVDDRAAIIREYVKQEILHWTPTKAQTAELATL